MDPARKAGAQAVIWTTGWLLLLSLLLGEGGSAAGGDGGGRVGALGRRSLLQGDLWGRSPILSRGGLWERSSVRVEGAVREVPQSGQRGLWEGSPALVRRSSGKGSLTELTGLREKFSHSERRTGRGGGEGVPPIHSKDPPILGSRGCGEDAPTVGIGGWKETGTRFVARFLLLSRKMVGNSIVTSRGQRAWEGLLLLSGTRLQ